MTATRIALSGALLLAWGVQVAACQRPPDDLIGHWEVDAEGLASLPEIRSLPEAERGPAVALAQRLMGDATVVLTGDGRVVRSRSGERQQGRWAVAQRSERVVVLDIQLDSQRPERWTLTPRGPDRITLTDSAGHALVLRRR